MHLKHTRLDTICNMDKPREFRPARKPRSFNKVIDKFAQAKIDEQHVSFDGEKVFVNEIGFNKKGDILAQEPHPVKEGKMITTFSDDYIERMSPNNIDVIHFWEKLHKEFPINAVAGSPDIQTVDQIHAAHENMFEIGFMDFVKDNVSPEKKVLEIGVGFGSMFKSLMKRGKVDPKNYYMLDVINRLDFKHSNFYKGNGWDIPKALNNMDVIVSWNTFQHLSEKQRISYFYDAFHRLNSGGIFTFSCFTIDDKDFKNVEFFNNVDDQGVPLTNFFGQQTRCMLFYRDMHLLTQTLGFEHVKAIQVRNTFIYVLRKP